MGIYEKYILPKFLNFAMKAPAMTKLRSRLVPLAEGKLENEVIICPRHGARFNVNTGQALCMPAFESVECYEVKIENDEIYISID